MNHSFVKEPELRNEYSHEKRMGYKTDLKDDTNLQGDHVPHHGKHPWVTSSVWNRTGPANETDACTFAVNRLKAGPPNVP